SRHQRVGAEDGVILVPAGIAFAGDLDVMLAIGKATESNRVGSGDLGAPGTGIEPPFVVGVTGTIGPAGGGNAIAGTDDANGEVGCGQAVSAIGLAGDRGAQGNDTAFVAVVWAAAERGRARQQAKPIAHDLRFLPGVEVSFRNL